MSFNFVESGQLCELRVYCWNATASQLAINVLKYRIGGAAFPLSSDAVAIAISTLIADKYIAVMDAAARYSGVSVQDWPARLNVASWSNAGAGNGAVVGLDIPTQVCGLISYYSNTAGAKGRGRSYLGFTSSTSNTTAGLPSAGYLTDAQALGDFMKFIAFSVVGDEYFAELVICDAIGASAPKPVLRAYAQPRWATQRRRGSFGRLNTLPPQLA